MRIALLSAEYPPLPGGIGDYTRQLGIALVAQHFDVRVVTITAARLRFVDLRTGSEDAPPVALPGAPAWGWQSWRTVIAALDILRPDLLHIQYQTGAYAMHPAINLLPWRLRGLPHRPRIVVTAHDLLEPYVFPKAGPLRRFLARRLLCDADATIVTNAEDAQELVRRRWFATSAGAAERLHAIPIGSNIPVVLSQGYDRAAWRARFGVAAHETLVAYFGLMGRSKGVDTLIAALAQLPASFKLLVIGGAATLPQDQAYAAAMQAQIDALGLRARVTISGQIDAALVSAHMHAADMAALPFADGASFRRGSLLATLAHGVPLVTTKRAEPRTANVAPSALVDGENVLLVPPGDAAALAAAVARLAGDAALRQRLGAAGRALADTFSWDGIAAQHAALYRALVAGSAR